MNRHRNLSFYIESMVLLLFLLAALVVALGVALAGKGLVTVAACACATVFLVERLLPLLPF